MDLRQCLCTEVPGLRKTDDGSTLNAGQVPCSIAVVAVEIEDFFQGGGSMDRDEEFRLLDRAVEHLRDKKIQLTDTDTRVGVERYRSPEWYQAELDRVFTRLPSMLVHTSEIPEAGAFVTLEHFGRPLLVSRDADGRAHVLLNACRHRGARVEQAESGLRRQFTCGYHAWRYDLDGTLSTIPSAYCFPGLGPGKRNLRSLPSVEAYGFVWLMPPDRPNRSDVDEFLGDFRPDIDDLGLADFEIYGAESHEWEINWKLVVEGTLEGYHFPFLHPKSANPLFENNTFFFDAFGPHLRSILPKRSINMLGRTKRSEQRLLSVANVIHTIFPNETVLHQSDHFLWITSHPLGPARTLVKLRLLVPPGSAAGPAAESWEENRRLTYQVQYEDLEIYREIQQGLAAGANDEHVFGTQEFALRTYNDTLERHLFGDDGQDGEGQDGEGADTPA
ncbi:aromatic ring-hydroxylating dioxygenase subunit alpha [Streptomyces monticola]|uniref:Aromatic ring-hydroxylating dioxygenase subunit alpha n=1 Tax=Streptomyces monticola TaxID=2666263 RepID=A0ABW2JQ07_9ACTN